MKEKVLIVDDHIANVDLLSIILADEYEVDKAYNSEEFWRCLKEDIPDVVLMDILMPDESGFSLIAKLQEIEPYKDIPVIFLSAKDESIDVMNGFETGGYDYIKKPYDIIELLARVKSAIKKNNKMLIMKEQALTDPLTGLFNRRYFFDRLTAEREKAKREKRPLTLAMLDIDFFKNINDTWGHQAGDLALKVFAHHIRSSIRPYDIAARYGGEEFVILFDGIYKSQSIQIIERIKTALKSENINYENANFRLKFSAGIVDNKDITTDSSNDNFIKIADARLYEAKSAGRDRIIS